MRKIVPKSLSGMDNVTDAFMSISYVFTIIIFIRINILTHSKSLYCDKNQERAFI